MFTDIVGYTALMGSDEDKAFEVLRKNRQIHLTFIGQFKGNLIKEIGDGMLAQFNSAIEAVQCAMEIQQQARNDLDAQIRIGIHLGDITLENNDVFGDGVNIASRLQSIAEPGGIYISESVHNAIRNKKDIESQYLGEVKLKNVNYPFRTYYIKGKGLSFPSKKRIDELTGAKRIESILILPFDNYTGSEELNYFVAGMHDSLIGAIGRISTIRVISKTTSNVYRHTEKSIPEIASELGVNAIIEGSVLSLEEKICCQIKLINAFPEEKQLWMHEYLEGKGEILNMYNKLTKEISKEVNVILTPEEERLLSKSRTIDREAYDAYLKSYQYMEDFNEDSLKKAQNYLKDAIDIDPNWAPLYTGLANIWMGLAQQSFEEPSIAYSMVYE
jgi:TolB-like protein